MSDLIEGALERAHDTYPTRLGTPVAPILREDPVVWGSADDGPMDASTLGLPLDDRALIGPRPGKTSDDVFIVYNSVENTCVEPFAAERPRPEFAGSRDFAPVG